MTKFGKHPDKDTVDLATEAVRGALLERWWLVTPEAAAKSVRFIDTYRSYVINYNLGRDLVQAWVERAGPDPAMRWRRFGELLASPRLPGGLE
jgi:hypothetical protein